MEKKIYTPREAWKLLGIGRTRFYQLLKERRIKYFKNGGHYLIPESSLVSFIEKNLIEDGERNG